MSKDFSQREIIKDAALALAVGETTRIVCPYCEARHEQSMIIRREVEGLHARCYRAKCPRSYTFITSLPSSDWLGKQKQRTFSPKYYTKECIDPPWEILHYINDMYEISPEEVEYYHFKYNEEENRLVMPIVNIHGYEIGMQTKALSSVVSGPKAISYFFNEGEKAHFVIKPEFYNSSTIVLVEDILSATKVGRLLPACALLSHGLTPDVANLLAANFSTMVVMLDPDALTKAVGIKHKYSLFFRNFSIIQLSKDPKDSPFTELQQILQPYRQDNYGAKNTSSNY